MEKTCTPTRSRALLAALLHWFTPLALACGWTLAGAQQAPVSATAFVPDPSPALAQEIRQMIQDRLTVPGGPRVEVRLGRLDPRLKLAPCQKVMPYLPSSGRLTGPARIGLRCAEGAVLWKVYLPVTVSLYGRGVVAAIDLPANHVLEAGDLREGEVDLAESRSPIWTDSARLVGRTVAAPVTAGQALRHMNIKPRQWFAAGDTVQVHAVGGGFNVVGSGEAISAGMEGQTARVRTDSGKVVSGLPVADRRLEVNL